MNDDTGDDGAWFAAKRYGLGSGMPVAWQGWAVLLGYFALLGLGAALFAWDFVVGGVAFAAIVFSSTIVLMLIASRKTRGGWRWRWGEDD
ncbi:hypothetical protein [Qipengyuania zhejiangensis]|uniref:hypothetical protein n=1 Tax=Qipengyuania zhejiangensis TaxID=3077782 RepID=UPI002D778F1E|nr:hypothetical protein [Qipengyuania sp. Z2]